MAYLVSTARMNLPIGSATKVRKGPCRLRVGNPDKWCVDQPLLDKIGIRWHANHHGNVNLFTKRVRQVAPDPDIEPDVRIARLKVRKARSNNFTPKGHGERHCQTPARRLSKAGKFGGRRVDLLEDAPRMTIELCAVMRQPQGAAAANEQLQTEAVFKSGKDSADA